MNGVAFAARALLVLVFAVAAVGKLIDRPAALQALREFRVPARLVEPVSWLLPVAELTVAGALLVQILARGAAAAAAVLLGLFMCGITAAMLRGEAPDCNCFGQIGSKPAGKTTLARNAVLAAVAVFVVIHGPGVDPGAWFRRQTTAEIVVLILVLTALALAAALPSLLSERHELRSDLGRLRASLALFPPGLPVGVDAPAFSLASTTGGQITLADLLALRRPVALVFVSPSCKPCHYMFPDISSWQRTLADRLTIALIAHGSMDDVHAMGQQFGLANVLSDPDAGVFREYRGQGTPSMVIVTHDGKVGIRIRSSHGAVEAAIRHALQNPQVPTADTPLIQVERRSGRDVEQPA